MAPQEESLARTTSDENETNPHLLALARHRSPSAL
jgi:hypothetical protein